MDIRCTIRIQCDIPLHCSAPFFALYTVPIIGKRSDDCTSRWGRRRPFIFGISLALILSLIMLVAGQSLVTEPLTRYVG